MKQALLFVATLTLSAAVARADLSPKQVYKKAGPAVVLILGSDDGKTGSGGTGSIISPQGHFITNAHVVISDSTGQPYKTLFVFLKPDKLTGDNTKDLKQRYKASCSKWSLKEELDLALCQMEGAPAGLPTISFTDPDEVEVGDQVVAIGHPEQGGLWTLTTGSVSTLIANFGRVKGKDVFQTEASINRGNSGGPLLDMQGNMIGVNTMIARQAADGVAITDINFSLKSSVAVGWLAQQGVALAYAAPRAEQPQAVAMATPTPQPAQPQPETRQPVAPAQQPAPQQPAITITIEPSEGQPVNKQVTPPPPPPAVSGKEQAPEAVTQGKPLDVKKAKPKYVTEKRPFSLDDLRKKQMKELEDMMDEMRGKVGSKKSEGMGLW